MTHEQRIVIKGAVLGAMSMLVLVVLFYIFLPDPDNAATATEQLIYALRWNALAVTPLFLMLARIGNRRFRGGGLDPLSGTRSRSFDIDTRVASNTLEQSFIFVVASLALATLLPAEQLSLIGALALTFIIARIVFWIGYQRHSLYRAPGMAMTYLLNLGMLVAVVVLAFF